MKKILPTFLLCNLLITSAIAANSQIKVIYGDDNRVDPVDSTNELFIKLSQSTAAMIDHTKLEEYNAEQFVVGGRSLEDTGVCSHERFASQPAMASCSGFLVGDNKLVTAGHCVRNISDCSSSSWVFGYKVQHELDSEVVIDKKDVYKCSSIISRELDSVTQNDYALIELDRVVEDRTPLKFREEGEVAVGDELVVIGHPSGLPTKISDKAYVRSVGETFLKANLDTYGGNSGSAVFNVKSGLVEGILVRGETDYVWSGSCRVSNRFDDNSGDGEDVTLIKMVPLEPSEDDEVENPGDDDTVSPEPPADVPGRESPIRRFLRWLRNIFR